MKKITTLFVLFLLISVSNLFQAANNYKLQAYGDADSDASLLVAASAYGDVSAAQKAIYINEVASPWRFGSYEFATQKFKIYTLQNANWVNNSEWHDSDNTSPIVFDGHTFVYNNGHSPVIFFVAPENAIYKVSTRFEYQSGNGDSQGYSLFQFKGKDSTSVVNMNFGKSYTAGNRVLLSDFYVNLHTGDTITFNQNATVWGDPFCQWSQLKVMGNNGGAPFTSEEANASGFYFDNYAVSTDFSFLNEKIAASEDLIGATVLGTYPASAITTFQSAIDVAKNFVLNNPDATQSEVNAQLAILSDAYTEFASSYIGANNYKSFPYNEAGSDANLLVAAGTYGDVETAQKAIVHQDVVSSPWRFGSYKSDSQELTIYSDLKNSWNGTQWGANSSVECPIVWNGLTFVYTPFESPVIFFVAPVSAIYKVITGFEYLSGNGDTRGFNYFQFKAKNGSTIYDMNFGNNYSAGNKVLTSDFYVNLLAGDTITFNQNATVWGDPFCQWTRLQVMRDNNGVAFTAADANASEKYFDRNLVVSSDAIIPITTMIANVENGIRITTDKVVHVSVYDLTGVNIKSCMVSLDATLALNKGIYIIKVDDVIRKVIVK